MGQMNTNPAYNKDSIFKSDVVNDEMLQIPSGTVAERLAALELQTRKVNELLTSVDLVDTNVEGVNDADLIKIENLNLAIRDILNNIPDLTNYFNKNESNLRFLTVVTGDERYILVSNEVELTLAEYNAMETHDPNTKYYIIEE